MVAVAGPKSGWDFGGLLQWRKRGNLVYDRVIRPVCDCLSVKQMVGLESVGAGVLFVVMLMFRWSAENIISLLYSGDAIPR